MGKIRIPRTDTTTRTANTPLLAELLYDTDLDEIWYGDGSTAGGLQLNANLGTILADIAQLQTDVSQLQTDLGNLTISVNTNTTNITTNTGNISTNTTNIATNTGDISTNATNISTNAGNISTNTTNITNNTNAISTNTTNIATNSSNISNNTTDIATNTANISTNSANISTNTANISTNTTDIANLTAALALLDESSTITVMTGNVTLTSTDTKWQIFDPNGANRIVDLPDPTTVLDLAYYILHNGTANRLRLFEDGVAIGFNIFRGQAALCKSDGVNWNIIRL